MIIKHRGFKPKYDSSVFIAPTAVVIGNVSIGKDSRVMYGSILDSEGSEVEIGECSIICENAVLRATASGDREYPVIIGDHVFVSPQSTLIGCKIESNSYIATGATILQGALVQSGAAVAVGAFIHANTVIPANSFIPPNNIAIGDPIKIYRPKDQEALAKAIKSIQFAKVAFNVDAKWENRFERYRQATKVRSKEFESHFDDEIIR
ncbi:MAG: gamma carbonic anhydrase family protein [Candidatus Lokiarchaeota archaeon]|nr:gamma carbonic anhydrase family protein [Candidatus Lokiarchaeota archaeon]